MMIPDADSRFMCKLVNRCSACAIACEVLGPTNLCLQMCSMEAEVCKGGCNCSMLGSGGMRQAQLNRITGQSPLSAGPNPNLQPCSWPRCITISACSCNFRTSI